MISAQHKILIGIDPGVQTGICVYLRPGKIISQAKTVKIHEAMKIVESFTSLKSQSGLYVRIEDARKRTWFGKADREQLQGAGSIKRDCKVWEDFLEDLGVDYEMVAPKNNKTKLSSDLFKKMTGYTGVTSVHARDACMLVFQL